MRKKTGRREIKDSKIGVFERIGQEIRTGCRIREIDGKIYKIYTPTMGDSEKISIYRQKITAQLYKDDDLWSINEAIDQLKERGTWSVEKQKQEEKLRDRLGKCYADIWFEKAKDEPEKQVLEELELEKFSLEVDLRILAGHKDDLIENTLEKLIDQKVNYYTMVLCIKDENENPVFPDLDSIMSSRDKTLIDRLAWEGRFFWTSGVDPALFIDSPADKSVGEDVQKTSEIEKVADDIFDVNQQ